MVEPKDDPVARLGGEKPAVQTFHWKLVWTNSTTQFNGTHCGNQTSDREGS